MHWHNLPCRHLPTTRLSPCIFVFLSFLVVSAFCIPVFFYQYFLCKSRWCNPATCLVDTCPPTGRPSQVESSPREVKATHSRLSFLLSPLTSLLVRKVFKYIWEKLSGRNLKFKKFNFERELQNYIYFSITKVSCSKGNYGPVANFSHLCQ